MVYPLMLFAAGIAALVWGFLAQRKRDAMHATPTLSCAEIASTGNGAPVTCEVKGAAVAGPNGPLRAPFSGAECVWYRAKVSVRYERTYYRDGRMYTDTHEETVHDETAGAPFGVQDATGVIVVEHDRAGIDGAQRSLNRFDRAGRDVNLFGLSIRVNFSNVKGHRYEEWIVAPGQPMYVLGSAARNGGGLVMRRPDGVPFIISTRSEEQLSNRLRMHTMAGYIGGGAAIASSLVWIAIKAFSG